MYKYVKKTFKKYKFGNYKHNKKNGNYKFLNQKHTKKNNLVQKEYKNKDKDIQSKKEDNDEKLQSGGNKNKQEKFEVTRLSDIDYSQFSISKYLDTNIEWGNSPGKPPMDCCIL